MEEPPEQLVAALDDLASYLDANHAGRAPRARRNGALLNAVEKHIGR